MICPHCGKETIPPASDYIAEHIYNLYPRKVGKPAAIKAIKRKLKGKEAKTLIMLTGLFANAWAGASRDDLRFCPHPATWFNQERFNDDPSTWCRVPAPDPHVAANGKRFSYMPGHALYGGQP